MGKPLSEDALCELLAEAIKGDPEFSLWFLQQTKFAACAGQARLLDAEQMAIRPRRRWWRHWWCRIPELAKDGETDIFMVFQHREKPTFRFAVHVENKKGGYRFSAGQAEAYACRGRHMCNKAAFLDHAEFTTVITAPEKFIQRFALDCAFFDAAVSHERIAAFIPAFRP